MTESINGKYCPKCKGILTPWEEPEWEQYVCDVCGYGKNSIEEFNELQATIKEKTKA